MPGLATCKGHNRADPASAMISTTLLHHIPHAARVLAFRVLEALSHMKNGGPRAEEAMAPGTTDPSSRSLWIFVSTIGELNAIDPLIQEMLDLLDQPELVLLTDRSTYDDAYLRKFPQARVEHVTGTSANARSLVRRRPPLMLLVAEIPCRLHDAPCRFSYSLMRAAKQAGATVALVNGWLYGYSPPSRIDATERHLFDRDYVRGFDLMMVQTEDVRQRLLSSGADAERVVVTGNIKFDAMQQMRSSPVMNPLAQALSRRGTDPVIVAGSVTETAEQRDLLQAFGAVLTAFPRALLVLAPRHPENLERMAALKLLLQASGLDWRLRSQNEPDPAVATSVLVLDTMGELRGCYAGATLAFVGPDHNVLEPLAFGKPVFVYGRWEPTYPSYPVYRQLLDSGVLVPADSAESLGRAWLLRLEASHQDSQRSSEQMDAVLSGAQGAVARSLVALRSCPFWTMLAARQAGLASASSTGRA